MNREGAFLSFLRNEFPDANVLEHDAFLLNLFVDDDHRYLITDKDDQRNALTEVDRHLSRAFGSLNRLHPVVARSLDEQFKKNSIDRLGFAPGTTLEFQRTRPRNGISLWQLLFAALYSLNGKVPEALLGSSHSEKQPSAVDAAKLSLDRYSNLSGKAKAEETLRKTAIVETAIQYWERYKGQPPKLESDGFVAFVRGILCILDEDDRKQWDALSVIRSYKNFSRKTNL